MPFLYGIGFDVSEYLVSEGHSTTLDTEAWLREWGVADPAAFQGSDEQTAQVFWDTALVLKRRIELMLALPMASLDQLAIRREIKAIGTR